MTHRKRVFLALAHKEPHRVPIDLRGTANHFIEGLSLEYFFAVHETASM